MRSCIPRALMPGLLEQLQRQILGRIVADFALAPMVSRRFPEIRLLRGRKRSNTTGILVKYWEVPLCGYVLAPPDGHSGLTILGVISFLFVPKVKLNGVFEVINAIKL